MAESLTLTTPVLARTGITIMRPATIMIDLPRAALVVTLLQWDGTNFIMDGRVLDYTYNATTTPTGITLIRALNKANLSANSLENRVMTQLKADHPELAGTITGAPD